MRYVDAGSKRHVAEAPVYKSCANLAQVLQESLALQLRVQFQTVRRFSANEDNRAGLRQALKADFSLEPDDLAKRAAIASVICTWEAAGQLEGDGVESTSLPLKLSLRQE